MHAIEAYKAYGQQLPPSGDLGRYVAQLAGSTKPTTRRVAADMYIDMARQYPDAAGAHIGHAREQLHAAVTQVYAAHDGAVESFSHSDAFCAVGALLRLAELENWLRAITGAPPLHAYPALLDAGSRAAPLTRQGHIDAKAELVQFMPVLLGSRAETRGSVAGWIGRLALEREDRGLSGNWDCAVTDGTPSGYLSPRVLLEVKSHYSGGAVNPGATAIKLRASVFGFDKPELVVRSCLNELGCMPPGPPDEPLLDSARLDEMTVQIRYRIDNPPKRGFA